MLNGWSRLKIKGHLKEIYSLLHVWKECDVEFSVMHGFMEMVQRVV